MNNVKSLLSATALLFMGSHGLFAITADPSLRTFTQLDGTQIQYTVVGDEFGHIAYNLQGMPMRFDAQVHRFVEMSQSEAERLSQLAEQKRLKANAQYMTALRSFSPNKRVKGASGQRNGFYPTVGERHSLVFLIEFSDLVFTTIDDPHQFYTRMLNEAGFSDFNATGSALDYYLEASTGLFHPIFDVVGPIRLDKPAAYYGANGEAGSDLHQADPLYEACIIADSLGLVDFTQYDCDENGIVDNIFYFYAGFGEADTGFEDTIWPHSWNLDDAELPLTLQGKKIYSYACSNEIRYQSNVTTYEPTGIGTFVHEFAHVLGLPDLYSTAGGMSSLYAHTPHDWSVMDHGPYNNDTHTPPTFSSFERYSVDWLNPVKLTVEADTTNVLQPLAQSNQAYLIEVPGNEQEYFLFENRQLAGWDTYLPNHGMLVWHITYDAERWKSNSPNNEAKQLVDIYEADGEAGSGSYPGDVMPGASNITSLPLYSWAEEQVLSPDYVRETSDGTIRFLLQGVDYSAAKPQSLVATDLSAHGFRLTWEEVAQATSYRVTVSNQDAEVTSQESSVATIAIDGLEPDTRYNVEVVAYVGNSVSEPAAIEVTTAALPFAQRTPTVLPATDIEATGFVAHWEPMTDADSYLLSLCQLQDAAESGVQGYDFSNKADGMPSMWQSSSTTYYAISGYYGEASPSLRFSKDQDYLLIAYPEATIVSLSFWMRGQKAQGSVDVEWRTDDDCEWQLLSNIPLSADEQTVNLSIENGASALRILYHRDGGFVAIDDVKVEIIAQEHTPLADYNDLPVGNTLQYAFTSLQPQTTYTYRIKAVNGSGEISLPSAEQYVVTLAQQGGTDPDPDPDPVTEPPHKILVEEFTSQSCIYCPMGAEYIQSAISGYKDRVVEVKHHAGYYSDNLTCEADIQYAQLFGINSAPTGIINRSEFGETCQITFNATLSPDSIRSTILRELEKPDYVTLNIEAAYDETTRLVTARIYGHLLQPLPCTQPRLNVWLTESGYRGMQQSTTGVHSNYLHTNYQRDCLTEIKGDNLTFDANGNFEQTFSYTIPESYPAYDESGASPSKSTPALPASTRIVAFVSNWSRADDCEVYNVNSLLIDGNPEDVDGIDQVNSDQSTPRPVYNLQGQRVGDDYHGIIVKNGRTLLVR